MHNPTYYKSTETQDNKILKAPIEKEKLPTRNKTGRWTNSSTGTRSTK